MKRQYAAEAALAFGDRDRFAALAGEPLLRLTTRLAAALMGDTAVIAALAGSCTVPAPFAAWIDAQIRSAWRFRAGPEVADKLIIGLVAARLRLFALTCSVFHNPLVKSLCPETGDEDVRSHVCRFLATLDTPQLDGVHTILVELFEPRRSGVERFLRAVQNEFALRAERGAATPAAAPSADWTPERFRDTNFAEAGLPGEEEVSTVPASQFWVIADALAWALGHPSWQQ